MFPWLRRHHRLLDLAVIASALVLSANLADEIGFTASIFTGLAIIVIVNFMLAFRPPFRSKIVTCTGYRLLMSTSLSKQVTKRAFLASLRYLRIPHKRRL